MTDRQDGADDAWVDALRTAMAAAGDSRAIDGWRVLTGGRAADTYLVEYAGGSRAVLRVNRAAGPTRGVTTSVSEQYALLARLADAGLPVPRPLLHGARLGPRGSYLLMEYVAGDVPSPWSRRGRALIGAEPLRSALPYELARTLARIHAVPVDALDDVPGERDHPALSELARWSALLRPTTFGRDPVVAWAVHRLRAELRESEAPALVHGDYRLGNVVVDDARVVGVIDWEMARIGDPLLDLGLLSSPPVVADWDRCGLPPVDELVNHYVARRGPVDPDALAATTLLATLKIVALWVNGASEREGTPTAAAARNALNAWGSRRLLLQAMGMTPGEHDADTARRRWRRDVEAELDRRRADRTIDHAPLPRALWEVPAPDPARDAALTTEVDACASELGITPRGGSAAERTTALVEALGDAGDGPARPLASRTSRRLEHLVAALGDEEFAPLPW